MGQILQSDCIKQLKDSKLSGGTSPLRVSKDTRQNSATFLSAKKEKKNWEEGWKLFKVSVLIYSWEETESTITNNRNPLQKNYRRNLWSQWPKQKLEVKNSPFTHRLLRQISGHYTIAKHKCRGRGVETGLICLVYEIQFTLNSAHFLVVN